MGSGLIGQWLTERLTRWLWCTWSVVLPNQHTLVPGVEACHKDLFYTDTHTQFVRERERRAHVLVCVYVVARVGWDARGQLARSCVSSTI